MDRKELRCCVAEAIGAFAIVFFGCGVIAFGVAGHLGINLTFGATVAAMVFALGHVSCAHFNPAVTVGFAVVRRFPWRLVVPYVLSQCVGALVACLALSALLPAHALAATSFGATVSTVGAVPTVLAEALLTFFLMLVIVSVATDARAAGLNAAIAIGLTVAVCGLTAGPLTGSSLNPARSFGPAVFAGGQALSTVWLYWVGPILGAVAGAFLYEFLRSPKRATLTAPSSCCQDC
jgi:MIP family channel proteins